MATGGDEELGRERTGHRDDVPPVTRQAVRLAPLDDRELVLRAAPRQYVELWPQAVERILVERRVAVVHARPKLLPRHHRVSKVGARRDCVVAACSTHRLSGELCNAAAPVQQRCSACAANKLGIPGNALGAER